MGDLSYPIYLVHYQGGLLTIALFGYLGITLQRHDPLMMACSLPVILLLSWLMTKVVERPIEVVRTMVKKA
jgi:peptidoglycan/LPS O-acetylase OafA/YrhL